jgi:UDP-N-acetylglucosamine acyltransferase
VKGGHPAFPNVMIHPTAIIHPSAQLGKDVSVGPYAVIEGAAIIGDGCTILGHAVIGAHVVMGRNNSIGYGAIVGGDPQDLSFKPSIQSRVIIGDNNRIREYCTLHRGSKDGWDTVVGNDNFLMGGTHLAHDVKVGNNVITANNVLLAGHVIVGDRVFLGGNSAYHQHIRIGTLAICQGISGYTKDVPPFCVGNGINGIAGMNVVGMRRAGLDAAARAEVKRAFTLLYRSGNNVKQALEIAQTQAWGAHAQIFWEFVRSAKKKGICDWVGSRIKVAEEGEE